MAELPPDRKSQSTAGRWSTLTECLERFEVAWQTGRPPELAQFVPFGDPIRRGVLAELIKTDQELRCAAARKSVEDYLAEWPELSDDGDTVLELLEAECLTRAGLGEVSSADELDRRFPNQAVDIDLAAVHPAAENESLSADAMCATAQTVAGDAGDTPCGASGAAVLYIGQRFGRYEVRSLLGHGGMGSVYLAYDVELDREVALKIPLLGQHGDVATRERFLHEARIAAKIRHPNICPVYDAGRIEGTYYLSMAYIAGDSLAERLNGRTIAESQAVDVATKLARALQVMHDLGIVHRDIKAANVMLDPSGEPLLMDFGLVRDLARDPQTSGAGGLLGTPAYMSPEQVNGDPTDARSDIYSLGVILYQLLTGRLPFTGSLSQVLAAIGTGSLRHRGIRPDLDPRLEAICLRAMAKNPQDRYASAADLAQALQHPQNHLPVGVHRCRNPRHIVRGGMPRHRPGMHLAVSSPFRAGKPPRPPQVSRKLSPSAPAFRVAGSAQPGWGIRRYDLCRPDFTLFASTRRLADQPFVEQMDRGGQLGVDRRRERRWEARSDCRGSAPRASLSRRRVGTRRRHRCWDSEHRGRHPRRRDTRDHCVAGRWRDSYPGGNGCLGEASCFNPHDAHGRRDRAVR